MKTIDILTENEKAVPIEERKGIDYARYVLNKNELYKYVAASYFSFFLFSPDKDNHFTKNDYLCGVF